MFYRVVFPYFGHPTLTMSFTRYIFLHSCAKIGNGSLEMFQLSISDLLFSQHAYSDFSVSKPRMTSQGRGVEVREHYPIRIPFRTQGINDKPNLLIHLSCIFVLRSLNLTDQLYISLNNNLTKCDFNRLDWQIFFVNFQ